MKKAFTLAEGLITLGIIGVVAAITLPTLITNYQKKVTVTRLKHAYSVLSQAIEQSEAINGEIVNWNFNNSVFEKYLVPNIKGISKLKLLGNGSLGITYRELSGKTENWLRLMTSKNTTIYTLANGTQILLDATGPYSQHIAVDINGFAKPNQFGKDLFYFIITPEHKLQPMGRYSDTECKFTNEPNNNRDNLKTGSSCSYYRYGCNKSGRGMWCGALIMLDGWEIAPDYPW